MSFKIDTEENNTSELKGFLSLLSGIETVIVVILAILQINTIVSEVLRIIGFVALTIFAVIVFGTIINIATDFFDRIFKKIFRKKGSEEIHYEHLKSIINFDCLNRRAKIINSKFEQHLEVKVQGADYFGFYRGLNIDITSYSLLTGEMKKVEEFTETWLCKFQEDPDTGVISINNSDNMKERVVTRPLMDSIETDEWNYTLKPLMDNGWTSIVLESVSLTPNHRYVKFALRKDDFLYIYAIKDMAKEVVQDDF